MKKSALTCLAAAGIFAPAIAFAADKSAYDFFNPTPTAQMRELSTDRPDKTESPYTVDAGHYQIEMDLVTYGYNHDKIGGEDLTESGYGIGVTNFKAGLTNSTDIQFVVESYLHDKIKDNVSGLSDSADGFGDVTVRLKHNFWGNDGGDTALAIMPFVKIPTNQNDLGNDDFEGGVIVPLALDLGDGWGLGLMTEVDYNKEEDNTGYSFGFVNSASLSRDLTDDLGAYLEFFTEKRAESNAHWENSVDFGFTYAAAENIQLDTGINIGVTDAAEDYNPFVGVTFRF